MKHHFANFLHLCMIAMLMVLGIFQPQSTVYAAPTLTITPITWNIIGLDSNAPASGPYLFPVGVRVCAAGATTTTIRFNWDNANTAYINLRTGTSATQTLTFTAAGCQDAYFEVQVSQVAGAFDQTRPYHITAENPGGIDLVSTPTPRELFVEHLISQNRNAITDIKLDGTSVAPGGTMTLMVGQTYTIDLVGGTATQGYNQFESFINFNNTIFQIVSKTVNTSDGVLTDYSANNAPTIGGGTAPVTDYQGLYANACIWDNNPTSPNYRSCIGGDYKTGGSAVTTTYTIKVISGAGTTQTLNSLLYDFSGSSFHYNADYSVGARFANIVGPSNVTIAKSFNPKSISPSGTSLLTITLTNPLPSAITGANFIDPFPANVTLLNTTTTNTCGGTLTDSTGGALGVGDVGVALGFGGVSIGTIPANGSCTITVNVTSTVNGTYSNITNNLFIDLGGTNTDTGNNANDSLRVSSAAPCTPGQSIAQWTFPAGFNVTNPAPSSGAGTASAGGGLNPASYTAGTNSWGTNGSVTTGAALVLANDDYLEFSIDTSLYSSVSLTFDAARANSGNAPTGIAVYYSGTSGNGAGVEPNAALYNNANVLTNTLTNIGGTLNIATPPTPTTYVRIYFFNSGNTNPGADGYLDNVTFTGCQNPPPDPSITKSFGTSPIELNGTSVLTFTINNTAAGSQALTGLAFTDTLPLGLTVATSGPTATCNGGSLTTTAPRTITFTGGSLAAGAFCNLNVTVTGATAGSFQNVTGFLSSTETGTTSNYATASLIVIAPPILAKSFNASSVLTSGTSTLTFTLTNPNTFNSLTGIGFTDNAGTGWPAGVTVATGGPTAACGGTYSTTAPNSLTFSGGTLALNASCTFSVSVTGATSGTKTDTTSAVTATGPIALTGNTTTGTLDVKDPVLLLGLNKQISTDNTNWFKYVGIIPTQDVYYKFTITNDGEADLTGISVDDSIYPGLVGCTPALPATLAVGTSASCVLGPISVTSAPTPNPLANIATATSNASTVTSQALYGTKSLSIVKNATESYFISAGDLLHYSYTVTNNGGYPLLGPVTVTDDKIGVVACQDTTLVGDNDAYLDPGESVICPATGTVSYTVTAGDVIAGSATNTAHGSAGGVDSPDAVKIVPLAALTIDNDTSTSIVSGNGNVAYTIVVVNTGQIDLTNFQVTDTLPFPAGQYTVTGVNASVTSGTINANGSYNGSSNTNLLAGTDILAIGATATITINLAMSNTTPGTYDNTATAITAQTGSIDDDGLVGGDPGTPGIGSDPETDEDVVVFGVQPSKSIVTTSEPSTGNVAGTERVTIGEMVRYRISSLIPEGSFANIQLTDIIPNGLQFLDDGTATVAFVCNGGAACMTSSTLAGVGLVVNGSSNNISPIFAVPGSAISGGPFGSGTDVTFSLGNITNTDSDADSEYVAIEFNALVLDVNTSAFINQGIDNSPGSLGGSNGNFRINTAVLSVNGLPIAPPSPNVTVSIAEPAITSITKSVSPATGPYLPGDALTYTMSFANVANGGSASTAFDVLLSDTFDTNLTVGVVTVTSTQGTSGVATCVGGTSFTTGSTTVGQLVTVTVSCLDPGNSVTVTVNAAIASSTSSGTTIANSSSLTYTSLPGTQGNCSTAPFTCIGVGTSGSGTGERNGSGGSGADNTVLNNYAVTSNTVNTTVTIPVVIDAVNDSGATVDGTAGGQSLANVLVNDILNGNSATLANVTLTQVSTTSPNVTLNPADGSVNVAPGTPAGNYTVTYQICDQVNPAICDTATVTVPVSVQQADLQLTKAVSNTTPLVATNIDFTITVTNVGPDPATNVQVTDQLPSGVTYVSDSTAPSGTTQGTYNVVTGLWDIGNLAVNQTETLMITVTVNISGPYTNYAEITVSDQADPDSTPNNGSTTEDDDDTVTVRPTQNNPSLGKTVSNSNQAFTTGSDAAIGEIVEYTVTINVPPGIFTNARLVDTMERGLSFMTCSSITGSDPALTTDVVGSFAGACSTPTVDDAGGGTTVDVGRRVTFDLGTLTNASGADQTLTFTYAVVVLDSAANVSGASLDNSAGFASDTGTMPPSRATITVVEPDLSIDKTSNISLVSVGSEVTITLAIQHTASSETNAYDVLLADVLPAELELVPGTLECVSGAQNADTCNYDTGSRTISALWNTFTLGGGDGRVTFRVTVVSLPSSGVSNTANVAWTSLPGDVSAPQNNNVFSKERDYDPISRIDVYGASDTLRLNVFGNNNSRNTLLPATGFAPNVVTDLGSEQKDIYTQTGGLTVEIPSLGIKIPIVGVPLKNGEWDVSWLANQAGWLEGSAFPSWSGNSVLTSHVYGSNGLPGPFVNLNKLRYGDKIIIHAYGRVYTYEVRANTVVEPNDASVFKHEEKSWLTLVTCKEYDEKANAYRKRVVVRAVLVSVGWE